MKRVIALFLSISFIFALVPAFSLTSVAADDPLCFTALEDNSTVKLKAENDGSLNPVFLSYSDDNKQTWKSYTVGTTITLTNVSNKLYFKGDNATFCMSDHDYYKFILDGQLSVSGNIMSLMNYRTTLTDGCFYFLFRGNDALISAAGLELPVTTLASECYANMFNGCVSLTDAPGLPAKTLASSCYYRMFEGTSLVKAPTLPATVLEDDCYRQMFCDCKVLTKAPALPATALAENCYRQMFEGCEALEIAPNLPATILLDSCYKRMFENCEALTNAPKLKPTALADECFNHMFYNCTSLEMITTTDAAKAIWAFPSTGASDWSSGMLVATPGSTDDPELGSMYICTSYVGIIDDSDEEIGEESDPETDIIADGKNQTLKYGNNTVVIDENTFDKTAMTKKIFYTIDYSESNAKIFDLIISNKVSKKIANDNKGVEFINRYGYMVVNKLDNNNNNSLVLRLKESAATYAQIKAMNTKHVDAEVEVSYKSNGKSLPGDVKVYVPCDMETARVFYIIDEHTIGEWKCTIENGYCVFDRYKDGTYVVCK